MPSYVSHAIQASNVLDKVYKDKQVFIEPDRDAMKTFAMLYDSPHSIKDLNNHDQHAKDLILKIAQIIKERKLFVDSEAISLLYGHICHFAFDAKVHPYINHLAARTKERKISPVSNHLLMELYLDEYLSKQLYKCDTLHLGCDFLGHANLHNPNIVDTVNDAYKTVYDHDKMIRYYRRFECLINDANLLKKLTHKQLADLFLFKHFLDKNNISVERITNVYHNQWLDSSDSFMDLYHQSLTLSQELINLVNKFIFQGKSFTLISDKFPTISIDTGQKIYTK